MSTSILKTRAKKLRTNQTDAETKLWWSLRHRQLNNVKFRRQHVIEGYIVDFISLDKKLIIEIDGSQHNENVAYDAKRTVILKNKGFKVIRFWNNEVLDDLEAVLESILKALD